MSTQVIVLGVLYLRFKRHKDQEREERRRTTTLVIAQLVLLILFLSYTTTSTTIFRPDRVEDDEEQRTGAVKDTGRSAEGRALDLRPPEAVRRRRAPRRGPAASPKF